MQPPYDIIVPSKGRPNAITLLQLEELNTKYILVVEKSDVLQYKTAFPSATFWVLPEENKGIGYSRHYILQTATRPFVMLDDDIYHTYKRVSTMKPLSLVAFLNEGWNHFSKLVNKHPNIAMYGCKHGTFAIPSNKWTWNTTIAHCVFVNVPLLRKMNIQYDISLRVFEDIDILFKCIQKSLRVVRDNRLIYTTPPSGTSSQGGVKYTKNTKERYLRKMIQMYPGWIESDFEKRSRDGQPKYIIHWNKL